MFQRTLARRACALAFTLHLVSPSSAIALEDETPGTIEEIIVTAGFRDSNLMTSSGSTSVIDHEILAERGARHLEDALALMPNVNSSAGGSRARFIQIRGVGDLEQFVDPKHFPSVGIVMDGIELSNVASSALLFDTEQVEVLRGPQGTRFGASALAGLVNIRSRDPGDTYQTDLNAGYGNLNSWHVSAAAGGPLSESLRGRLAIRQNTSDGFVKNDFLGRDDTQDTDELAVRGKIIWDIAPALQADLTTLYLDADNGYDVFTLDNSRTTLADEPGTDAQEIAALGLKLRWDLDALGSAEINTTWTDAEETYGFDEDWVFSGFCDGVRCDPVNEFSASDVIERERDQVSVDLRWLAGVDGVSWVTGAYFHHRNEDMQRRRFGLFSSAYATNRYALYGQFAFLLHDRWSARLGLRGEAFDDEYSDTNAIATTSNDTFWSGEATLEYQARVDTLLYATLSRGAKPGGVNTNASSVQAAVAARFRAFIGDRQRFASETLLNKEVGLKGRYFDDRVTLRLSAFHMDRSDAQLESWIWDATNFLFVGFLDNVADASNYGLELEFDAELNDVLTFTSRVGYLETNVATMTVFDLDRDAFASLNDREQTKAPRWQYHFGLRWQILAALTGHVAIEGRDESFFGYYHSEKLDAYSVLNASLSYRHKQAEVRLWARNLLDKDYAVHGLYFANDPRDAFSLNRAYQQLGEPRVYGVDLSWSF